MAKSPIEPGAIEPTPRPRRQRQRASIDGMDFSAVIKARKKQDRVLHARLKEIDREIDKLMREHEQISELLGLASKEDASDDHSQISNGMQAQAYEFTCADCGSHAGPNSRGDCAKCGAGPFEQAR